MSLTHPDDLEIIDGVYYQNLHSYDEDTNFSHSLFCPICGKHEIFILPTNNSDQSDTLVTEKNKVSITNQLWEFWYGYTIDYLKVVRIFLFYTDKIHLPYDTKFWREKILANFVNYK